MTTYEHRATIIDGNTLTTNNERHDMNMNTTRHLKSIPFNYNGTTFHIIGNTAQGFTGITWDNGKYESLEVTRRENDDFLEIVRKALKENEVTL